MEIIDTNLIDPYFLPDVLNGEIYENVSRKNLIKLSEDGLLVNMLFPHDECPAHFCTKIRDWEMNTNTKGPPKILISYIYVIYRHTHTLYR